MNSDLCFGFSVNSWRSLSSSMENGDEGAWNKAIDVFERRMLERFFNPIKALEAGDTKPDLTSEDGEGPSQDECIPGFAIIAICCLLIEAIQDFREEVKPVEPHQGSCDYPGGRCIKPGSGTNQRFKAFLQLPAFKHSFDDALTSKFCKGIRNAILHNAETRGWVIWRSEPKDTIVAREQDGYALNRTLFCAAVKDEFDSFLKALRKPDSQDLRQHFKTRMDRLSEKA